MYRKGYIHRDQILDSLWPGLESDVASRHFKVALNAMLNVIEPHRPPRLNSFTVHRDGQLYAINPMAGLWTDADEFESLATKAGRLAAADPAGACDLYRHALSLYHGDFLQECLYEDWATAERERLLAVYLRAAGRTAELLLEVRELDECIDVCEQIIAKDPCWEEAYRILIQCAAERANPTMALRLYERCETALQSEMGISPSRETRELLDRATRQG
ncbi:MAG: Bacterial transcriptional activator domain protein [Firmicutes bacterium ADurb.Bin506]|nr:MAG: Bacterial transcriptional activator domain protein [Firmicutes bacterium ADurb.Bin506]